MEKHQMKTNQLRKSRPFIVFAVLSTLLLSGCGITASGLDDHAGYANIDSPYWWQADSHVNLSLGPTTLLAARWLTSIDDDPEVKALLKDVDGVRISIYKVEKNDDMFKQKMAQTRASLNQDGWHPVVLVNEKDESETTSIYMKSDGDTIDGLVVLKLSDEEATFVNVIGDIHPDSFEPLMAQVYSKNK